MKLSPLRPNTVLLRFLEEKRGGKSNYNDDTEDKEKDLDEDKDGGFEPPEKREENPILIRQLSKLFR